MNDDTEALRESLTHLHEQLESVESVDAESRVLLQTLIDDIRGVLGAQAAASQQAAHDSFADRLTHAARRFEASHPVLTPALDRVISALANLGI